MPHLRLWGGAKAVCGRICFHPLEVIKSDSTAVREVFYAVAEVEGGQTAAVQSRKLDSKLWTLFRGCTDTKFLSCFFFCSVKVYLTSTVYALCPADAAEHNGQRPLALFQCMQKLYLKLLSLGRDF